MKRRDFIKWSLGTGTAIVCSKSFADSELGKKIAENNKSCIFIFLGGGISIADSFCVKPNTPQEYAPINGVIQTKASYLLGSNFPSLASIADKMTLVHNYKTFDGNHNSATAYSLTGKPAFGIPEGSNAKEPSIASLASHFHGTNNEKNGLPTYVKLDKMLHQGSAWLGAKYVGFEANEDGINTLKINTTPEQFSRRNTIVNDLELYNGRTDHYFKEWSNLRNQAKEIIMGDAAQAFNLKNEDKVWLEKYNAEKNRFGKNCLLARRLIQSGSKIVTLNHDGWDMHGDISKGFNDRSSDLDQYLATLILDLESKGMLKDTLVVVTSEFSRTKLNVTAGRDHNPNICSLLFLGGNYGGSVIGQSDKYALNAEGNPFAPKDLSWTILNWLGIPENYTIVDNMKRPRHVVENESRIIV